MHKPRFFALTLTLLTSLFVAPAAFAQLTLQPDASQVNFISIKNEHIAEIHSFDKFSGNLSAAGDLSIDINLASVNTLIPIRNERMRSMLFNVTDFASATFAAKVDPAVMSMTVGAHKDLSISGDLRIKDQSVETTFDVRVTKLSDGRIQATTIKPTLINAASFDLVEGIKALQDIAMLNSISHTVPLSFSVVFK